MSSKWKTKEEKLSHIGGKVCLFGLEGDGKSTVAGTFPVIGLIDSEEGQTYYLEGNDNIKFVLPTTSASDTQEAIDDLEDDEMIDSITTLVLDSGTKIYENMQASAYEVAEKRAKKQKRMGKDIDLDDLNLAPRDWGHIKRWNQALNTAYIKLSSKGKWAVITAHQKDVFDDPMSLKKKKIGVQPDLAKKSGHDFDIIMRCFKEKDKDSEKYRFYGEICKDRTQCTEVGDIIENPSFEIWREKWESTKKYGVKEVDMTKDVETSASALTIEVETIEEWVSKIKDGLKELATDKQNQVLKKSKEMGVNNPFKSNDIDFLKELYEFIGSLE